MKKHGQLMEKVRPLSAFGKWLITKKLSIYYFNIGSFIELLSRDPR